MPLWTLSRSLHVAVSGGEGEALIAYITGFVMCHALRYEGRNLTKTHLYIVDWCKAYYNVFSTYIYIIFPWSSMYLYGIWKQQFLLFLAPKNPLGKRRGPLQKCFQGIGSLPAGKLTFPYYSKQRTRHWTMVAKLLLGMFFVLVSFWHLTETYRNKDVLQINWIYSEKCPVIKQ